MHHFVAIGEFKLELQCGNAQFGSKSTFFLAVWPCNLMYDLEQGKSEGFESCDRPIVRKRPIWVKISDVLYRVTLKFDGWPWKTIGHLSFAVSSFVQHFVAIGELKLELQSGNAQSRSHSTIFRAAWPWNWRMTLKNNRAPLLCYFKLYASFRSHRWIQAGVTVRKRPIWVKIDFFFSRVTLQFDVWPWTRQIWGIWKLRPAYSPETPNLGQYRWCFVPCDLEIWWMTLENNRAPLLCCFNTGGHRTRVAAVTLDSMAERVFAQREELPYSAVLTIDFLSISDSIG